MVFVILIRWIVIYPEDSAIQRLYNRGQDLRLYRHYNTANCVRDGALTILIIKSQKRSF